MEKKATAVNVEEKIKAKVAETKVKIEMCVELAEGESIENFRPFKSHKSDAGFDLISAETGYIAPGQRKLFSAGFKMELEEGWEAQIRPRSGNALKKGLTVLNTPGTIDSGYQGVVGVILYNAGDNLYTIKKGDKIAQMVIQRVPNVELEFTEIDKTSDRGADGFGSTGVAGL